MSENYYLIQAAIIQAAASLAAVSVAAQLPEPNDDHEEIRLKLLQEKYFRWAYENVTAILEDIDEERARRHAGHSLSKKA